MAARWAAVHAHRVCLVEQCNRPHLARGLCSMHWQRAKKSGELRHHRKAQIPKRKGCSVDGCDRAHHARGLCNMHHKRAMWRGTLDQHSWNDTSSVEPITRQDRKCSEPDCDRKHRARGLCYMHYQRAKAAKFCSKRGCQKPVKGKGLCHNHYQHQNQRQNRQRRKAGIKCLVPDCDALEFDHGLCRPHFIAVKNIDGLDDWDDLKSTLFTSGDGD